MRLRALVVGFVLGVGAACAVTDADLAGARCVPGTADDCGAGTGLVCDARLNRCVLKGELDAGALGGGAGGGVGGGAQGGGTGGGTGGGVPDAGEVDGGCAAPETFCSSAGACVNTSTDSSHCGGCDTSCVNATECAAGACVCPTNAPNRCVSDAGSLVVTCADLQNDPSNCGGCGLVCDANRNQVCRGGACGCAQGQLDCGIGCIDVTSDNANCGACGVGCQVQGEKCVNSNCACQSPTPDFCTGSCVDKLTDNRHCGGCGNQCTGGRSCAGGLCKLTGETCANPELLQPSSGPTLTLQGTTVAYTDDVNIDANTCAQNAMAGPDRVYRVHVLAGKQLTVTVTPQSPGIFDVVLYAKYATDCGFATACPLSLVDFRGAGQPETLSLPSQASDVDLDLMVDSADNSTGAYSLAYSSQ